MNPCLFPVFVTVAFTLPARSIDPNPHRPREFRDSNHQISVASPQHGEPGARFSSGSDLCAAKLHRNPCSTSQPAAMKAVAAPTPLIAPTPPPTHKMGPLQININWRERTEDWNWFKGNTGNSDYTFWDSLLRIGIGQTGKQFDWYIDGEQPTIIGLPTTAV